MVKFDKCKIVYKVKNKNFKMYTSLWIGFKKCYLYIKDVGWKLKAIFFLEEV